MLLVSGVLKGYDQLLNLVLDEGIEYLRGELWLVNERGIVCVDEHINYK